MRDKAERSKEIGTANKDEDRRECEKVLREECWKRCGKENKEKAEETGNREVTVERTRRKIKEGKWNENKR